MAHINLNGKLLSAANANILVDNRAFRYGYGLFETMLVQNGSIHLGEYHFERLFAGLKQLYFDIPALMSAEWLQNEVLRTVAKNDLNKLCRVRLQMYAGSGGLYDIKNATPEYVIECFPLNAEILKLNENGLVAGIANGLKKSADGLANLKSCSALIYAIAAQQAKAEKWNDALIVNTSNNIIESTLANIFWVEGEAVYTPPLSEGCVAGVMRRYTLDEAKEKGLAITEKILSPDTLMNADEVFLTNAIRRIKWIKEIGNKNYSCRLIKKYAEMLFN